MHKLIGLSLLAAATTFSSAALANGCNGVVSQLEWGCAAWDNNNGPQFPHYNKTGAAQVPSASQVMGNKGALIPQDGGGRPTPGIVHPPTGTGR
jgi:hypothetical protein